MATTFAPLTVEEFERLPESDRKCELNDGVLVEVVVTALAAPNSWWRQKV